MRRWLLAGMLISTGGCGLLDRVPKGPHDTTTSYHDNHGLEIEYPEVEQCATPVTEAASQATEPLSLEDPSKIPVLEMTLQEAIEMAVRQSPVIRALGGSVVTAPQATATIYDPSLVSADPVTGPEAALSDFDAQYTQQLFWNKVDTPNNVNPVDLQDPILSRFLRSAFVATQATYSGELAKQTAQGARFALRHVVNYDRNNQPNRFFRSDFEGWLEAEWRQPLLQGAGTQYNRIVGSNNIPGLYNGVLIGRANEDTALADFEAAIVQLVADVEQAYWDLATAYRVLDAAVKGRESALKTYQYQQVRLEVGTGRRDEEAQARSQFYQFEALVQSLLGGQPGLYSVEQRLRYLIGMPATDGRLIQPTTPLADMKVTFDWSSALGQALQRRVEVRRQRVQVKRREWELYAARLNRRPRLDFLGQYRWRGLGDNLIGDTDSGIQIDNLYASITDGDFQEWRAGLELNFPVGFRAASVAIAHAKLNLHRERALLNETELRISHDLSAAGRQIKIAHQLMESNYNRYISDLRQVDVLERRYRDGSDNINFLLQAQRLLVESETDFYRAIGEYNLAIRDFHRQKGSLLAFNQVQLTEGAWAAGATQDAYHVGRFMTPRRDPSKVRAPSAMSRGPFDPSAVQDTSGAAIGIATDVSDQDLPTPIQSNSPTPLIDQLPAPADADSAGPTINAWEQVIGSSTLRPNTNAADELISSGPSWSSQ